MTFEPIDWDDEPEHELGDEPGEPALSIGERFKAYLAARRDAGLGHRDPDTDETAALWRMDEQPGG